MTSTFYITVFTVRSSNRLTRLFQKYSSVLCLTMERRREVSNDCAYQQQRGHTGHGITCQNPKNPRMREYSARVLTFRNWNEYIIAASVEQLADAGLYYLGVGDRTKCYYCDGGLENWDYDDDPCFEHAKWFPKCEFIQSKKGSNYVDTVTDQFPNLPPPAVHSASSPVGSSVYQIGSTTIVSPGANFISFGNAWNMEPFNIQTVTVSRNNDSESNQPISSQTRCYRGNPSILNTSAPQAPKTGSGKPAEQMKNTSENQGKSNSSQDEVQKRVEDIKEENRCKICFERDVGCVFDPCGHLCACMQCGLMLKLCPICRIDIIKMVKIFKA